jgi:hypothetical protein
VELVHIADSLHSEKSVNDLRPIGPLLTCWMIETIANHAHICVNVEYGSTLQIELPHAARYDLRFDKCFFPSLST